MYRKYGALSSELLVDQTHSSWGHWRIEEKWRRTQQCPQHSASPLAPPEFRPPSFHTQITTATSQPLLPPLLSLSVSYTDNPYSYLKLILKCITHWLKRSFRICPVVFSGKIEHDSETSLHLPCSCLSRFMSRCRPFLSSLFSTSPGTR